MEVSIHSQALGLLSFCLLGLGLGLCYDLLRLPRYALSHPLLWDGLFCALAAAGCFCLSMERGRLGPWDLLSALACFCLYLNFMSNWIFPILPLIFRPFSTIVRFLEKKYFFLKKLLFK